MLPPEEAGDSLLNDPSAPIIIEPPSERESFLHLRHFIVERAPWFQSEIKDILWIARAQFDRQLAQRFGDGRCWLAGDAAHQTSPAGMLSMNLGLREAADLANKLKSILRGDSGPDLLQTYDRVHRLEWERLLGLTTPVEPPISLSPWVSRHYPTIFGNLPASGDDLDHLLHAVKC
jgi:2-polyprenyl-6-methoxyphenol hydroxylase-like FAD-dependent oxidoreductase